MDELPLQLVKRATGDNWVQLDTFCKVYQQELENLQAFNPRVNNSEQALLHLPSMVRVGERVARELSARRVMVNTDLPTF